MGKTIALEIPEKEFASFEGVLDKALAALRGANNKATHERDKRVARLEAETKVLLDQIKVELHVEKTL